MTLLDTYNSFIGALATGQLGLLPAFVDPDAYTETCVGLTGWTQGLDVALANFQYGIGAAFADLNMDVRDIVQSPGSVVIRARSAPPTSGPSSALTRPAAGSSGTRSTWPNPARTDGSPGGSASTTGKASAASCSANLPHPRPPYDTSSKPRLAIRSRRPPRSQRVADATTRAQSGTPGGSKR